MKGKSKLLKAGILCLASLSLVGCGKDDGLAADGKVEIEYFNQKKEMTDIIKELRRILKRKIQISKSKSSMFLHRVMC